MKYSKSEIKECADGLQKLTNRLSKHAKSAEKIHADAAAIESEIAEIGEPAYTDDLAIERLAKLQMKLRLCQQARERHDDSYSAFSSQIREVIYPASMMAGNILAEIGERRLETITCSLLPFCFNRARAVSIARSTDAYQRAGGTVLYYTGITSRLTMQSAGASAIAAAANEILAVLNEALKDAPDFMKFLPFQTESTDTPAEATS